MHLGRSGHKWIAETPCCLHLCLARVAKASSWPCVKIFVTGYITSARRSKGLAHSISAALHCFRVLVCCHRNSQHILHEWDFLVTSHFSVVAGDALVFTKDMWSNASQTTWQVVELVQFECILVVIYTWIWCCPLVIRLFVLYWITQFLSPSLLLFISAF